MDLRARLACHDDRDPRQLGNPFADRTHQHFGESTAATTADHQQLGFLRAFDELSCRLIADHDTVNIYIGVLLLPSR